MINLENLEKRKRIVHFIEKWLIIFIVLFVIVQVSCGIIINKMVPDDSKESVAEYDKNYMGHWYIGTFFIEMNVDDNFKSYEDYEKLINYRKTNSISNACYILGSISFVISLTLLVVSAIKERKGKLLSGKTPLIVLISAIFLLLYKIFEEIDLYYDVYAYHKYSKGFLSTVSYYPMINNIFILPVLLILLGLFLLRKQKQNMKKAISKIDKWIKLICSLILLVGLSFIVYRLGIRIYEFINPSINIRIPSYYFMFDLPREYAVSNTSYNKLIIIRLLKDLPVFISSTLSIIIFVKIVLSYLKNKRDIKKTKKRYMIIFISLLVSSIIFNLLGYYEVHLLNKEFLYQYHDAVYTLAIRSLTEPLLYYIFIYSFKYYIDFAYTNK